MSEIKILENVDIKILKPYEQNVFDHEHNMSEIISSIRDFGYSKVSIGIDENNVLLYGHGTLEALKMLSFTIVPMVARISGLTEDQKKCYRIADNTTGYNSRIINAMLKEELSNQLSFDFANYGMPIAQLLNLDQNDTTGQLDKTAEDFNEQNPDFVRPEKLWMYIQFDTKEQWELAITNLGKNKSRRVIDTAKFMEVFNAYLQKR